MYMFILSFYFLFTWIRISSSRPYVYERTARLTSRGRPAVPPELGVSNDVGAMFAPFSSMCWWSNTLCVVVARGRRHKARRQGCAPAAEVFGRVGRPSARQVVPGTFANYKRVRTPRSNDSFTMPCLRYVQSPIRVEPVSSFVHH